jgi:hypothetical protein
VIEARDLLWLFHRGDGPASPAIDPSTSIVSHLPPRRTCPYSGLVSDVRPLWQCPRCDRTFANANQTHTCAALGDLDSHFRGTQPHVREAFDRILSAVRGFGPVTVLPEKSRIALHVRMSFAAVIPRIRWLNGHLVLARAVDSERFRRVDTYSPRNVVHAFRLVSPDEVDDEFIGWLAQAYEVGQQRHLG